MNPLIEWLKDETGQGLPEYGLIIGLVAIVVVAALLVLGPKVRALYDTIGDYIPTSTSHYDSGYHYGHGKT